MDSKSVGAFAVTGAVVIAAGLAIWLVPSSPEPMSERDRSELFYKQFEVTPPPVDSVSARNEKGSKRKGKSSSDKSKKKSKKSKGKGKSTPKGAPGPSGPGYNPSTPL